MKHSASSARLVLVPQLRQSLERLLQSATEELLISSPYISADGTRLALSNLGPAFRNHGRFLLLTDISATSVVQSSTDLLAVADLSRLVGASSLVHLPRLHAKVYVADRRRAIISSANFTAGGLIRNYEYGVEITDPAIASQIHSDMEGLAELGALVTREDLESYRTEIEDVRIRFLEIERRGTEKVRIQLRNAEQSLIAMRLRGGAMHTVFARTIEYLLKKNGPMPTTKLHPMIAQLHPDLCDDSIDRIINGYSYGKKWKHAVRTAQQQLKKTGRIEYDNNQWKLASH
jgi:hypothetical protein